MNTEKTEAKCYIYPVELEKPIFHTKIGKQNNAPQNGKILFIGT